MIEQQTDSAAFSVRVEQLCQEVGSEAELERRAALPPGTLSHYTRRRPSEPRRSHLVALARGAEVSLEWLATGSGAMRSEYVSPSAKGAETKGSPEFVDALSFRRDWLIRELRIGKPDSIGVVRAVGNTMSPLIEDGDLVLLDCEDRELLDGAVYAMAIANAFFIRRVTRQASRIFLKSDNGIADSVELTHEELSRLNFMGRVLWVGKNAK
jgi:phage repressor protein C with HTH and peptisase S24 domain